jgi:biotin carboxylase
VERVVTLREPPFGKLLVANRGEVAVRVIRACRELGIASVAVYSEADEGAMHVRLADEAYLVGPAEASESYLNIESVVRVAKDCGADAVHPGYGFLSENAEFARAVEEAGIAWVGPAAEAMEKVGDKVRAKELAREAEVPTVPGYAGEEDESEERLQKRPRRSGIRFSSRRAPAAADAGCVPYARRKTLSRPSGGPGGGGGGFRGGGGLSREARGGSAARRGAGDRRRPRNDVHLYERECSIQRRHQKIIEEAPSPALDEDLRESLGAAAVRLTETAGYRNAGTVEFLLEDEDFYFLEMNARLQVEHPVTELVTGLDLVHLQLAVAAGSPCRSRRRRRSARRRDRGARLRRGPVHRPASRRQSTGLRTAQPVPESATTSALRPVTRSPWTTTRCSES